MPSKTIILAAVFLSAGGAWWALPKFSDERVEHVSGKARSPAEATDARTQNDLALRYGPITGKTYLYRFERKVRFQGIDGNPESQFKGTLAITVVQKKNGNFYSVFSERIEGESRSAEILAAFPESARDVTIHLDPKMAKESAPHVDVLKDLVALWLFPLERDTAGTYTASSTRFTEDFFHWKKTKLAYKGDLAPKILDSVHFLQWNDTLSVPQRIKGSERSDMSSLGMSISALSEYEIQLEKMIPAQAMGYSVENKFSSASTLALSALTKHDKFAHPDYAKLNWEEVRARLQNMNEMTASERLAAFGDLVRLMEMDPALASKLLAMLSKEEMRLGAKSELFKMVVGALATNGGKEALQALRAIYDNGEVPVSGKGAVLGALTTTEAPLDAATREFLRAKMQSEKNLDLIYGAAFAAGSDLQRAPADAPATIQLIQSAWSRQANGNDVMQQLALLDVMGNSGRAEFLPILEKTARDSTNSEVRARSIFALRFVNDPTAVTIINQSVTDPEARIRNAGVGAIAHTKERSPYRGSLEQCRAREQEAQIQKACASLLLEENT